MEGGLEMESAWIIRIVAGVLFAAPPDSGQLTRIVPWIQRRRINQMGCRWPVLQLR
jgi:hypothetical protein